MVEERSQYYPSILHEPRDYTAGSPIGRVKELLLSTLVLSIKDDRIIEGRFTAFDKFGNFVLCDAVETFRDSTREMRMVVVPLEWVTRVQVKKQGQAASEES